MMLRNKLPCSKLRLFNHDVLQVKTLQVYMHSRRNLDESYALSDSIPSAELSCVTTERNMIMPCRYAYRHIYMA